MTLSKFEQSGKKLDVAEFQRKKTELANMMSDLIVADAEPEDLLAIMEVIKSRKMKSETALLRKSDTLLGTLYPFLKMPTALLDPITSCLSLKDGMALGKVANGFSQAKFFALKKKHLKNRK